MLPADPSLSVAERVDAACDHFEAEWKAGNRPRIDDFITTAPESDREELRQALLALEVELQGRSEAETSVSRSSVRSKENAHPTATVDHKQSIQSSVNKIGRFEIRGVLGSGAFGKVYRAFDPQLGREVAVKVPLATTVQSEKERAQFLKEARSSANINHPNVCQIHEVGEADGRPYIVMTLVRGQSLADTINARKEPLPEKQTALVVRKIALALAAAHDSGIVHRDLKPANVMFDRERKDIVVMDFGLARGPKLGDARGTHSGVIMGTPAYMSPEQARGDSKGVGPAGDIFSLGVILYELLTGTRPFTGTATEVIGKILHVEPERPSAVRPEVDPRLEAVCLKAMAKDPAVRFATMQQFAAAVDAVLRAPVPTGPVADTARAGTTRREGNDQSTSTDNNLAEVFAALSDDRKQARAETAAVVEAAIAKHRTPRWMFLLIGLLFAGGLTALAGIVFFTRSDKVKVTIELTDVDLADKSLSFFLDDEPVSAEALANPIELTPGEHVLTVKRGRETVKRMLLTVTGGRNPGIRVRDITPPPVEEPLKPVKHGEWQDLLAEVDSAKLPPEWKMQEGKLVGKRDAEAAPNMLLRQFGEGIEGNYDLEFDFRFQDCSPAFLFLPLNGSAICAEITRGGSALQTIDGKPADEGKGLVNFVPGTSNKQARTTDKTLQSVTASVRQSGADVDVIVKLGAVEIGHFIGARSRLTQPEWGKLTSGQIKIGAATRKDVPGWFEIHKLRVKRLTNTDDDLARWQGRWRCVTENSWGKVVYDNDRTGKGPVQIITGNTRELNKVSANSAVLVGTSQFRINGAVTPKTFDCDEFGPGKFRQSGIYEFAGNRLRLVYRFAKDTPPVRATWADIGKPDVHYYEFERTLDDGFVPLFNGKDFTGWEAPTQPNAFWVDADGHLATQSTTPESTIHWLFTTKEYSDYILRFEFKFVADLSADTMIGITPRSVSDSALARRAMRLKIPLHSKNSWPYTGAVYYGIDDTLAPSPPVSDLAIGTWHTAELEARGNRIKLTLDGKLVNDVDLAKVDRTRLGQSQRWAEAELDRTTGHIGIHSSLKLTQFRNIRIKE